MVGWWGGGGGGEGREGEYRAEWMPNTLSFIIIHDHHTHPILPHPLLPQPQVGRPGRTCAGEPEEDERGRGRRRDHGGCR